MEYLLGGKDKLDQARARPLGPVEPRVQALATFEVTRPLVGASALGIAQAAYEWTLEYLEDKEEDGVPLMEQQRVQQVLADVGTEIEASRLLVARRLDGPQRHPDDRRPGLHVQAQGGRRDHVATTTLMDLVGPYAQTTDCPLEKWYRDAKIYQIFEGTAQVQRLVVSRMQRREYQERLKEAAEVLEQVPSVAATAA